MERYSNKKKIENVIARNKCKKCNKRMRRIMAIGSRTFKAHKGSMCRLCGLIQTDKAVNEPVLFLNKVTHKRGCTCRECMENEYGAIF